MNVHIEEYLAHEKLAEARARAATSLRLQAVDTGRLDSASPSGSR